MAPISPGQSDDLTQKSYKPTEYADESFPVVGAPPSPLEFVPMNIAVLDANTPIDQMFADYGGVDSAKKPMRWHLPENIGWKSEEEKKKERQQRVEPTVAYTEREIAKIKAEAREEGRLVGFESAVDENAKKLLALEERARTLLTDLKTQIEEHRATTERKAVELTLQISKLILEHAVEINPEYIVNVVRDALSKVGSSTVHSIRVSSQDLEFINVLGVRTALKEFDGSWEFTADPAVKSGCVVECSSGEIDLRLDEAWERIRNNVVKVTS